MARPLVSDAIEHLRPYEPGKPIDEVRRELGVDDPVKLASNENAWGPPPAALEAARKALDEVHRYPDGGAFHLRRELAAFLGCDPGQLVFGNGSNEIIELVVRTFVQPGDNVVTSAASFVAYKLATLACDRELREAPIGPDLGYDLDALAGLVDARTRVIFVANPNNPTGTFVDAGAIARFVDAVDARCGDDPPIIVLDQAYLEYVDPGADIDAIALVARRPRTIALRTFSKAYGLSGLRVGYGVTSPELVGYLERVRAPFNVNSVAQEAARGALSAIDYVTDVVRETVALRERLADDLRGLGLRVVPSQTNFLLVDFGRPAQPIHEALMRAGVIARPMGPYGLREHLRVTVGRAEENARCVAALRDVLGR